MVIFQGKVHDRIKKAVLVPVKVQHVSPGMSYEYSLNKGSFKLARAPPRGLVSTNLSPGVHPVQPIHLAVNYKTIDARLSNRSVQLIKNRVNRRRKIYRAHRPGRFMANTRLCCETWP